MKNKHLFDNYKNLIKEHIASKGFRPQTPRELSVRLNIIPAHIDVFYSSIQALQEEKLCFIQKDSGWILPKAQEALQQFPFGHGKLSLSPRGFGFVLIDEVEHSREKSELLKGASEDTFIGKEVFIPKTMLRGAMHRDRVCVQITGKDHRGYEGEVLRIVSHSDQTLYGLLLEKVRLGGDSYWKVHVPIMAEQRFFIPEGKDSSLTVGTRVALKRGSGKNPSMGTSLELVEVCGHIDDPSEDLEFAIGEHALSWEFPPATFEETRDLGTEVSEESMKGRKDLRELTTFTIDPSTAKDFDDAISIHESRFDDKPAYCLYVHIADVPAYVKEGSALDLEAKARANSTYLPGYCIPMLPPELSNELCSLKPQVDRLAVTTEIYLCSKTGHLLSSKTYRSVIHSDHRYSYEEAMELLDQLSGVQDIKKLDPLEQAIVLMSRLYPLREALRRDKGQISLALDETQIELDKKGQPIGVKKVAYDLSHKIIEEFMVTTNEEIAKRMSADKLSAIYRVHESPDSKSFEPFKQLTASLGYDFDVENDIEQLQNFFSEMQGNARYSQICLSYIRCMKMAYYSQDNHGHFGLCLDHYCHFTSPIRRYSDLITMRSLFGEAKNKTYESEALYLSERERISSQAEMSVSLLKKWRYLKMQLAEGNELYEGVITKIMPFGVVVSLKDLLLEVLVPLPRLSPHYLELDMKLGTLTCTETEQLLHSGSEITLQLKSVNLILKEGDWEVPGFELQQKPRRGQRRERKFKNAQKEKESEKKKKAKKGIKGKKRF